MKILITLAFMFTALHGAIANAGIKRICDTNVGELAPNGAFTSQEPFDSDMLESWKALAADPATVKTCIEGHDRVMIGRFAEGWQIVFFPLSSGQICPTSPKYKMIGIDCVSMSADGHPVRIVPSSYCEQ